MSYEDYDMLARKQLDKTLVQELVEGTCIGFSKFSFGTGMSCLRKLVKHAEASESSLAKHYPSLLHAAVGSVRRTFSTGGWKVGKDGLAETERLAKEWNLSLANDYPTLLHAAVGSVRRTFSNWGWQVGKDGLSTAAELARKWRDACPGCSVQSFKKVLDHFDNFAAANYDRHVADHLQQAMMAELERIACLCKPEVISRGGSSQPWKGKCLFLAIPREIRDMILGFAIGDTGSDYIEKQLHGFPGGRPEDFSQLPVLRTCKQIRQEAFENADQRRCFFAFSDSMLALLSNMNLKPCRIGFWLNPYAAEELPKFATMSSVTSVTICSNPWAGNIASESLMIGYQVILRIIRESPKLTNLNFLTGCSSKIQSSSDMESCSHALHLRDFFNSHADQGLNPFEKGSRSTKFSISAGAEKRIVYLNITSIY